MSKLPVGVPDDIAFHTKYIIDPVTGCWVWQDSLNDSGYGAYWCREQEKLIPAHRYSYERYKGPIPKGMEADHTCLNRACVNYDHLVAATPKENRLRKRLHITHCPKGHEYTPENSLYISSGTHRDTKARRCRECNRIKCEQQKLKRKIA